MTERNYTIAMEVNGEARTATIPARLTLVDLLRDELGGAPAPETTELFERLRRGEQV